MAVFLFLKQIVDMFYQYKILDYGMVVFAVVLLGRKIWTDKIYLHLKEFLCPADFAVMALMAVYTGAFLRYPAAYGIFFKVESAFLIYFLGRAYGRKIMQYGRGLAWAGYIAVYLNFFYRFYLFGFRFFLEPGEEDLLNRGGLYYYKTDLAVGIMIAVLFIYMFAEQNWFKWITILPVCGYTVFYSGARMQQLFFAAEYIFLLLCELEKRTKFVFRMKAAVIKVLMAVISLAAFTFFGVMQFIPFGKLAERMQTESGLGLLLEKLMHSRHIIWCDILDYVSEQSFWTRLFGIDLQTEYMHTSANMRAHSIYIKQLYATGYAGCFLLLFLIGLILYRLCKESDRKLFYSVLVLWLVMLGSGLTIESLEATQMSWFPFLFAGMLFAGRETDTGKGYEKKHGKDADYV